MNINRILREAGPKGVWAFALGLVVAATVTWAIVGFNPAEEGADHIAEPVASSLGIVHERCPSGWDDVSATDVHMRSLACLRDGWLVVLTPDGLFSHAIQDNVPGSVIVEDPTQVPEWE